MNSKKADLRRKVPKKKWKSKRPKSASLIIGYIIKILSSAFKTVTTKNSKNADLRRKVPGEKSKRNKKLALGLAGIFLTIFIILGILPTLGFNSSPVQNENNFKDLEASPVQNENNFKDLETGPQLASSIVFGASFIEVPANATVVTQVNRVTRDATINYKMNNPPDHRPISDRELVDYMEGARVAELMRYANVQVIPATNVPLKKINRTWYGPDDMGNFVFAIDPSKLSPKFSNVAGDTATAIETHGMNVLVPEAIKDHAFLVVGCGDIMGKAEAEAYMAERGINCYAPCDRYTSSIMPYKGPGVILGTEPIRPLSNGKGAIIGGQPLYISTKEKIIVQTTHKAYPHQYCDTPYRFFTNLQKSYGINLDLDVVDASVGETELVVSEARKIGANVIAVRVERENDKKPVEGWLNESKEHKAILFHSAAYEPGYSLFFEFPYQVTGQDPKPVFIKATSDAELQKRFYQIRSKWG